MLSVTGATAVEALEADIETVGVILSGMKLGSGHMTNFQGLNGRCSSQ